MPDNDFALALLLLALAVLAVLGVSRLSARVRLPLPALVLVAAAVTARLDPGLRPSDRLVSRVVTVALVAILFHGGMRLGRGRVKAAAAPILVIGLAGTFATAGLAAVALQLAFHLGWYPSFLVATAVAPTDPAVVFSLLGRQAGEGRATILLQGESGANDPVGIALMAGLLGTGGFGAGAGRAVGHVAGTFFVQMAVGAAVGIAGAVVLRWVMHHVHLPGEGLYPLRTLAGAFALYGLGALCHGSGFLAVFVGGIVLGDEPVPFRSEIESFHDALSGLGEIVAFASLGLTVDLHEVSLARTWGPGIALGAVLAVAIRPIVVWACLAGGKWRGALPSAGDRRFVQFAGLKGAVPILLGISILRAGVEGSARLYGIVLVVVLFSVVVQGSAVASLTSGARHVPKQLRRPGPVRFPRRGRP